MPKKTLYDYLRLPYTERVEATLYRAWVEEIPSIEAYGPSAEIAQSRLAETFPRRIRTMLQEGRPIAEPRLWPAGLCGPDGTDVLRRVIHEVQEGSREPERPRRLRVVDGWRVQDGHEAMSIRLVP